MFQIQSIGIYTSKAKYSSVYVLIEGGVRIATFFTKEAAEEWINDWFDNDDCEV